MAPTSPLSRLTLAVLLLLAAAASCGGGPTIVEESELSGRRYVLERTGDAHVPMVAWIDGRDTTMLLADTIEFGPSSSATRAVAWRYAWGDSAPRVQTFRGPTEFWLRDGQVVIGRRAPCPPNALCTPNLIGFATGTELRLMPDNGVPSPASVYRRADPIYSASSASLNR